ncbi:hypothetical protein XI03_11220 [Bradyrhizobium sp. CCBAU 65884]|uniref:hypothetical protein n=1 Tax=Bradyrhizobium sp. CCBAU 65884 TaxID=722477 RepID=UPI0023062E41|nr:hypothetical protein [Bradyrhizobium sp. CCBAU 65884]MDA9475059.1 hypothetical protein [Bradyrhizobium sp. CCBAU 65884]
MTTIRIQTIQIPANSCDADCMPLRHNKWQIDFPIVDPARIGIGYLVEPAPFVFTPVPFAMHDHHYSSNNTPDSARANVTYRFTAAAIVRDLIVVQHTNGITEIEGAVSDTGAAGSWQSIGIAKSRLVTDPVSGATPTGANMFVEGSRDLFVFPNPAAARPYLRIVIHKTSLLDGWATYRIYPRNDQNDPYTVASQNSLMTRAGQVVTP